MSRFKSCFGIAVLVCFSSSTASILSGAHDGAGKSGMGKSFTENEQQRQSQQGRRFLGMPWGRGSKPSSSLSSSPPKPSSVALATRGGVIDQFARVVMGARGHLVAAGSARAVSIFAMYPVDTIKTRLQMGKPILGGGLGVGGLYRGLVGSMIGQVPYGTLTFGSYEVYKEQLAARFPNLGLFSRTTMAAILGDLTGSFWLCPSEVLKQQVQGGVYRDMGAAVQGIWRESGMKGFYRGYSAQIARDVPFRVVQLVAYEFAKKMYISLRENWEPSPSNSLAAWEGAVVGAVAGSFSAAVTTPLDVLKTRMMTGSALGAASVFEAAQLIVTKEGPMALFKGIAPRVGLIGPSCAVFFMVYEFVHRNFPMD